MHLSDDERRRFQQIAAGLPVSAQPTTRTPALPLTGLSPAGPDVRLLGAALAGLLVVLVVGGATWLAAAAMLGVVSLVSVLLVRGGRRAAHGHLRGHR